MLPHRVRAGQCCQQAVIGLADMLAFDQEVSRSLHERPTAFECQTFSAGDEIGTIESVKAVAEIYTPVSGEVIEVNGELENRPELVNEDAHGGGWLIHVRMSDVEELTSLMSAETYQELIEAEEA